jgi:ribosomal-protein-alanine N-acetyltransferase
MSLETRRLLLREFVEADAEATNVYERDPEVVRYTSHGTRSLEESRAYIRRILDAANETPRSVYDFALLRKDDMRLIGRCGFRIASHEQREAMLWYVLDRAAWGNAYVAEAARAVLSFGFDRLRLHRFFVDIDPRNTASLRVAEKLGMRREGHFIENALVKGEWTDTIICGLLDREHRANFGQA